MQRATVFAILFMKAYYVHSGDECVRERRRV